MNIKTRSIKPIAIVIAVLTAVIFAAMPLAGCNRRTPEQKYTVTFVTGSGSSVRAQSLPSGALVVKPEDPTLAGYEFVAWYKDAKYKTEWNFDVDRVDGNITLYAKWRNKTSPSTCVVNFVTGCSIAVPSQTLTVGDRVQEPPAITREGFVFAGWYADENYVSEWHFAYDTVSAPLTLYAKWTPKGGTDPDPDPDPDPNPDPITPDPSRGKVTATFNVGLDARKAGLSNPPAQTVVYGSRLAAPSVTREGYTLDGWYIEEGADKWSFDSTALTKNTTLFAKWRSGSDMPSGYVPGASLQIADTLYIHYLRDAGDYDGWCLWVWLDNAGGTRYASSIVDESGKVYAIDLSMLGSPAKVNFKAAVISASGTWGTEDGNDCAVTVSSAQKIGNSYHWYIKEGATNRGSSSFTGGGNSGGDVPPVTEPLRASANNVNRATAAALPVMDTASGCEDMGVGYQIFVASFCDSDGDGVGDIRGIISKLDYLDGLNVDVLWLTPIQSSDSLHGYDCYDYYSVDPKFGTNADYRELVYKAHERGIKVIMDLVVNHTSRSNEWFIKSKKGVVETVTYQDGTTAEVKYRDFYRWKNTGGNRYCSAGDGWYYYSSFGEWMPELNYDCQQVRDAMSDVAMYWMAYGLDGFRMDAIKHVFMWDESENASGDVEAAAYDTGYNFNMTKNVEFFKEFNHNLKTKYPDCFLLGEQLSGDVACVAPFYAGMDSLFDFNTYFDLPSRINTGNAAAAADKFNYNAAQYALYREDKPINSMITSNHDKDRFSKVMGADTQKMKLYFATVMTLPGLSWIYYGDEIGLKNNGSGDNAFRQSMRWTQDWENKCTCIGYGGTNTAVASVAEQAGDESSLLYYVKGLTAVRDAHPALINGTATCDVYDGMLRITVQNADEKLVVYHNYGSGSKTVSQSGELLFGSAALGAYGTAIYKV